MAQDPEQNYFGNVVLLHKYIEDILPTFQTETMVWMSQLAACMLKLTFCGLRYLIAFILWMHKMD